MLFLSENFNNYLFSMVLAGLLLFLILRNPDKPFSWVSFSLAGLMLLSMRLPVIYFNNQLNVDESQMVANLRLFRLEPIYWQSIDGGTIGPFAYYIAWIATFFEEQIDYQSIRWLGFACLVFSLILFYRIVIKTTSTLAANFALFLLICFFTFLTHPDFLHYSSEQLPILLTNLTIYWQVIEWKKSKLDVKKQFLIGFLIALIPWVKIQTIPICGIMALFQLLHLSRRAREERTKAICLFFTGIFSFVLVFILWANCYSVLDDFWIYYIEDNVIYTGKNKIPYGLIKFIKFLGKSFDFFALLLGGGFMITLAILTNLKGLRRFEFGYFSLLFISGLFAATVTRNNFPHYLYLVIFPLGYLFAFSINVVSQNFQKYHLLSLAILMGWFWMKEIYFHENTQHLQRMKHEKTLAISPVGNYIQRISKANDRISIWGWQGKLYIESNRLQASAENHTLHCMQPSELKIKHIQRYLGDLERNKAQMLVDASQDDPGYLSPIEKVPEVHAYVKANYQLDTTIANNRIFIRKR